MATILIVEDKQEVRRLLMTILMPEYQVTQADDAAQAIELARHTLPDVILLDLHLQSHQDGLEVCRALRSESNPVLAHVPIVMLTGATTEADIKAALAAGADTYMSKPYNPYSLLALISRLLASRAGME